LCQKLQIRQRLSADSPLAPSWQRRSSAANISQATAFPAGDDIPREGSLLFPRRFWCSVEHDKAREGSIAFYCIALLRLNFLHTAP